MAHAIFETFMLKWIQIWLSMLFFSDNLTDKEKHAVMGEGILSSQKRLRRLLQEEEAGLEPK